MDMIISFPGGKKVNAEYKGFTVKTDQPKNQGGEGSAPEPFSLFLVSLGTCAGYYVANFCQQRNLSTEGLHLLLRTEKNSQTHLVSNIKIDIIIPKDFPDKYQKALIRSAESCTVKKQLQDPPQFHIAVKKK